MDDMLVCWSHALSMQGFWSARQLFADLVATGLHFDNCLLMRHCRPMVPDHCGVQ